MQMRGAVGEEKGKGERSIQKCTRTFFQSNWLGKWKELNSVSPYNWQGLKPRVLKYSGFGWYEPWEHRATPGEKAGKQPGGRQSGNSDLKNAWGTLGGDYSLFSECFTFGETPLQEQRSWLAPFPSPTPQYEHWATCGKQLRADTGGLTWLHQVLHPCTLAWPSFSFKLTSVPVL